MKRAYPRGQRKGRMDGGVEDTLVEGEEGGCVGYTRVEQRKKKRQRRSVSVEVKIKQRMNEKMNERGMV